MLTFGLIQADKGGKMYIEKDLKQEFDNISELNNSTLIKLNGKGPKKIPQLFKKTYLFFR